MVQCFCSTLYVFYSNFINIKLTVEHKSTYNKLSSQKALMTSHAMFDNQLYHVFFITCPHCDATGSSFVSGGKIVRNGIDNNR